MGNLEFQSLIGSQYKLMKKLSGLSTDIFVSIPNRDSLLTLQRPTIKLPESADIFNANNC
ncbi:hypothetical protein WA1_32060 [Scytonema hofmannii PCC 7110]|uniref:Uncharacterized protein n=1 Tax=Scytonema hofmannii PCC 7110 TaxID=128403 RepID=A0A139X3U4_9CYAN|nr:hypothetical protein WA1_32060 [Scytonema hofmannii PCC 7110]